ncbi:MAG: S8 family serine peptidase [Bacteroidota bacterium]
MRNVVSATLILLLFSFASQAGAQNRMGMEKYWIFLTDKGDISAIQPQEILTQRALDRRAKHGVAVDFRDYPVHPAYREALAGTGAELRHPSKWFNAVSVWMDDATKEQVAALPFVREIKLIPKVIVDYDAPDPISYKIGYDAGSTAAQLDMIGLDQLHQNGYNGRGVLIAVMDNGFDELDQNPHLEHLISNNQLVATYDFVNDEVDVFNQGNHGHWVLSILAGWYEDPFNSEGNFYGSAHGADFILCHTEEDAAETNREEDNWVAAMEFADSLGADILSTSLGYRDFDGGFDYGYAGLDGNTTIITRGADIAASRGIIVVNSAGNNGNGKLLAPADGDSVIAVGAVNSERIVAGFSSRGPAYDGRIKPDVCAMGTQTSFINKGGIFARGNGTSFSCPVISGFLACLLQAAPEKTNMELYDALIRSADRFDNPDEAYGYGIPSVKSAFKAVTGENIAGAVTTESLVENGLQVFPNPAGDQFSLVVDNESTAYPAVFQIVDTRGKIVLERELTVAPFYNVLHFDRATDYPNLSAGMYTVRLRAADDSPAGVLNLTARLSLFD